MYVSVRCRGKASVPWCAERGGGGGKCLPFSAGRQDQPSTGTLLQPIGRRHSCPPAQQTDHPPLRWPTDRLQSSLNSQESQAGSLWQKERSTPVTEVTLLSSISSRTCTTIITNPDSTMIL